MLGNAGARLTGEGITIDGVGERLDTESARLAAEDVTV